MGILNINSCYSTRLFTPSVLPLPLPLFSFLFLSLFLLSYLYKTRAQAIGHNRFYFFIPPPTLGADKRCRSKSQPLSLSLSLSPHHHLSPTLLRTCPYPPAGRREWTSGAGTITLTTTPEPPLGSGPRPSPCATTSSGRASGASCRAPCTSSASASSTRYLLALRPAAQRVEFAWSSRIRLQERSSLGEKKKGKQRHNSITKISCSPLGEPNLIFFLINLFHKNKKTLAHFYQVE